MNPWYFELTIAALALLGVSAAAVWDWRTRCVPNTIALPFLAVAVLIRVLWLSCYPDQSLWFALGGAILLQLAWSKDLLGGGDAKTFTALWMLWPTAGWLIVWMASLVLGYVAFRWVWPRRGWSLPQPQTLTNSGERVSLSFPALCPVAGGALLYVGLIVIQGLRLF